MQCSAQSPFIVLKRVAIVSRVYKVPLSPRLFHALIFSLPFSKPGLYQSGGTYSQLKMTQDTSVLIPKLSIRYERRSRQKGYRKGSWSPKWCSLPTTFTNGFEAEEWGTYFLPTWSREKDKSWIDVHSGRAEYHWAWFWLWVELQRFRSKVSGASQWRSISEANYPTKGTEKSAKDLVLPMRGSTRIYQLKMSLQPCYKRLWTMWALWLPSYIGRHTCREYSSWTYSGSPKST